MLNSGCWLSHQQAQRSGSNDRGSQIHSSFIRIVNQEAEFIWREQFDSVIQSNVVAQGLKQLGIIMKLIKFFYFFLQYHFLH